MVPNTHRFLGMKLILIPKYMGIYLFPNIAKCLKTCTISIIISLTNNYKKEYFPKIQFI